MNARAFKNLAATKLLPLLLLLLPAAVRTQDAYSTNTDGSIYTYSTNADGSANIVAYAGPPWVVTIPTNINGLTVTSIGEDAFKNNTNLTSITIPGSVTSIGDSAFGFCSSLTNATIGNGVTNIGNVAFDSCASLTSVTIPNSVTSIGNSAFFQSSLTSITIPNSVTSIGGGAFGYCPSLTSITVDASNPGYSSTNGVLFDKAQATLLQFPGGLGGSYTIPNSATSIGDAAFAVCYSLTSVTIPGSVTSIGQAAFSACSSLTNATIGNGVTSIGDSAFDSCASLTSVTIPNSVTNIGNSAFEYCLSLTSITVDASNPAYSSTNGVLFDKAQATLLQFPGGLGGSYTIPNSVTSIVDAAFENCSALTSVTIGNNVTSIGEGVFLNCSSLTNATIGNGVTGIGDDAFLRCGLTSVTIPNSVTNIGNSAFEYCLSLTSVTIPNSVTSIGEYAFGETDLTSVTIPGSVTSIGHGAFAFYYSLTSVYFTGNVPSPTNDSTVFYDNYYATVYYLPGTTGWGAMFDGRPTAPWFLPNPQILNHSAGFGVQPGGFGFTISWATNVSVVVEAATNLANPVWIPVSTNTLTGGTNFFSDPHWTNYPGRFYRLSSP